MTYIVGEKISVVTIYDKVKETVMPWKIKWNNQEYTVKKLGYYHRVREGRKILHIYNVTDGQLDFSLVCDGDNLHWSLKEVLDVSIL